MRTLSDPFSVAVVLTVIPLAAAGTAKLLAPYANAPLFEGLLLRVPIIRSLAPSVALRLLGALELLVASALTFAGVGAAIALAIAVLLYGSFVCAVVVGYRRRLPCPCFGLDSSRPITVCRIIGTLVAFLSALYAAAVVVATGSVTSLNSVDSYWFWVAILVGSVLAVGAWTLARADLRDLRKSLSARDPSHREAAESDYSEDRRSLLKAGPMMALAFVLPRHTNAYAAGPGSVDKLLPPIDATNLRELANVRRLLARKGVRDNDVAWASARTADIGEGALRVKFAIIPQVGALSDPKASPWLLVAARTRQGPAAAFYDLADSSAIVAVRTGWAEIREGNLVTDGLPKMNAGCGDCAVGGSICCMVGGVCGPAWGYCCAACGAGTIGCCLLNMCQSLADSPPSLN